MKNTNSARIMLGRILGCIPAYSDWNTKQIDSTTLSMIDSADRQQLLNVAAYALYRVLAEQSDTKVNN